MNRLQIITLLIVILVLLSGCSHNKTNDSIDITNNSSEFKNSTSESSRGKEGITSREEEVSKEESTSGDEQESESEVVDSEDEESVNSNTSSDSSTHNNASNNSKWPSNDSSFGDENSDNNENSNSESSVDEQEVHPWEVLGAKQPKDYTWIEFQKLTTVQKEAFEKTFASTEEFQVWLDDKYKDMVNDEVENEQSMMKNPWENGGKQPNEYTWTEYEALTPQQKEAFFDWFDSVEAFDVWMKGTQEESSSPYPWENGGKQPDEYTWTEYEALTPQQKEAFFDWFDSVEAFDMWMKGTQEESSSPYPWENGGKQPNEYTWTEYEALIPQQKEAFFDWFDSVEAFDMWMKGTQEESSSLYPWENGGKQPDEYTWTEYEALTPQQKEAFFDWFDSVESFDSWLQQAQG